MCEQLTAVIPEKKKVQNPFKFVMLQNEVCKGEGQDMK
jgi:hypothetical protein